METSIDGPVFVVGMNGSGTTMLSDSLGMHPSLYMFPYEIRLLPYFIQRHTQFGNLGLLANRRRCADALCAAKPFWQLNKRQAFRLPDECLDEPGLAGCINGVFGYFASRAGKQRWGEKSPMNVLHMTTLSEVFPKARFVHIVRDGRDAARSFQRRFGFVPAETIYRWKRVVKAGRRQGEALGAARYFEVGYEQITADPEHWMRLVCAFLELPFDPAVLDLSMHTSDPLAAGAHIVPNSGKWAEYFSRKDVCRLEAIAGRQLAARGYPVSIEGDDDPTGLQLKWWRLRGAAKRTVIQVRRYGRRGIVPYVREAFVGIKQSRAGRM